MRVRIDMHRIKSCYAMILLIKTIDGANNVAIVAIRKKLDEYPNAIFSTRREIKIEQK